MSNPDFATLFNDLLAEKDFSPAELARRTGLDEGTLSKWANPERKPKPKRENLLKLRGHGFSDAEVNSLLNAAGYSTLSPQEIAPLPPPGDLERYLRHVRDRQAILDFSIFQEGSEQDFASVPLDTFYIPLRLAGRPPDEEKDSTGLPNLSGLQRELDLHSDYLLSPTIHLSHHLVLLGDAGSGKTTLLRQLTGVLAKAFLENDPEFARQCTGLGGELLLPLFVPLRYYHHYCQAAPGRAVAMGSFLDFLPFHFREQFGLALPPDFFLTLLGSGRCLLTLDGFDEVPDETSRRQVTALIRDLATDSELGQNSIILSSRVAAYGGTAQLGGSFKTLWVQRLNPKERAEQISRWVAGMAPHTQKELKAEDILRLMSEGSPLDQLAVTPMIVTALCVVYFYDHKLPEQRAQLYRRCVDIMLREKLRPDEPGQSLADQGGKPDFKRDLLARLAFEMHLNQKEGVNKEQAAHWLRDGFRSAPTAERLERAYEFLNTITGRGTLLQERAGLFSFGRQHRTFREFLAGYHLIKGLPAAERQTLWPRLLRADEWREPIRLAAGATVFEFSLTCEDFLNELLAQADAPRADSATRLAGYKLAAESLVDMGQAGRGMLAFDLQSQIIERLAQRLFHDPAIADPTADLLKERAAAAETLARLGDPRSGVTDLPPLLTDPIEGEFLYGDKKKEHRTVAPFQAGVYPITNAQFEQFWREKGYDNQDWWSPEGWKWRQSKPRYDWQKTDQSDFWGDERFNQPNQPVVGVTWYEAEAFCNWLSASSGREYRLPTEEEWERLARGQDGWEYPWGNGWCEGLSNTRELDLNQTTAVGLFPGGISPAGVHDCAGNVWEWCANWADEKQTDRALRSGSWYLDQLNARCAVRYGNSPYFSFSYIGFRVVSPIK
jgi:formylglycine-generating enzyme required for sulfatase activity/transcriptional regulator with XRE-family HTH domain